MKHPIAKDEWYKAIQKSQTRKTAPYNHKYLPEEVGNATKQKK